MVSGVSGSFADNPQYQFYQQQYQEMKTKYGGKLTFEEYLRLKNVDFGYSMQVLENIIETGDEKKGDGIKGNSISDNRYLNSTEKPGTQMFQTQDMDGFYEVDWETGTYKYVDDPKEAARMLGLDPESFDMDTIVFGAGTAEITDFIFNADWLSDGQDRNENKLNGNYKNVTYNIQEFDPCYLIDKSLQDPSDPEYQKALKNWEYLQATVDQWMSDADYAKISDLDPESEEYKTALLEIILDKLDQTKSFGDHKHVENKNTGTVEETPGNGSEGDDSDANKVPTYDKDTVLDNAGLLSAYTNGTLWKSEFINRKDKSQDEARNQAMAQSAAYAEAVLKDIEAAMVAELGDQLTPEMKTYLTKAKKAALESKEWQDYEWHNAMLNKNKGFTSTCDTKKLIDSFYKEFDSLCANGGKSSAQVEAENKKKEELKGDYKKFYEFNIKDSSVKPDNVKSEYTVSMTGGNYKQTAQNNVLKPYSAKILNSIKSKCPKLTESQIQKILDTAMANALNDDSWVTTNGNVATGGTYSIDTDKLLDSFSAEIKTAIKKSGGYDPDKP